MIKPMAHIPKYQEIINRIRSGIADGTLRPGDKLPVRDELTERYQVTRTTIDRAIGELIRSGDLVASRRNGTFIANTLEDKAAIITWKESIYLHRAQWGEASNFYAMYGRLFQALPASQYEIIDPGQVQRNPAVLRRFRRILWNSVNREEFDTVADTLGDRSRFLLLNRDFDGCDFVSTDHRQAAFDLTETFLARLPNADCVVFLDMPNAQNLSSREVWERRQLGFVDACEKYRKFYRILNFKQDDFAGNLALLHRFVGRRTADAPGIIISPTRTAIGCMLGFLNVTESRLNREYYYGDFDNDHSLLDYGQAIPTVVQNFAGIAEAAAAGFRESGLRRYVPHQIINSPWETAATEGVLR